MMSGIHKNYQVLANKHWILISNLHYKLQGASLQSREHNNDEFYRRIRFFIQIHIFQG